VKPGNGNASVTKGTRVIWKNTGDSPHNVKVTKGPVKFSSGTLLPGRAYDRRMRKRGTYTIICTIHGSKQKMTLRVK
jgi:plastocyanin